MFEAGTKKTGTFCRLETTLKHTLLYTQDVGSLEEDRSASAEFFCLFLLSGNMQLKIKNAPKENKDLLFATFTSFASMKPALLSI